MPRLNFLSSPFLTKYQLVAHLNKPFWLPYSLSNWTSLSESHTKIVVFLSQRYFSLTLHLQRNKTCLLWLRLNLPLMNRPSDCAWEEITTISRCPRMTGPCLWLQVTSWQGATQPKLGLADTIKAEPTHPESHEKTRGAYSISIKDQHLEMKIFGLLIISVWLALMLMWSKQW